MKGGVASMLLAAEILRELNVHLSGDILFATVAMLGLATAIPAFADSGDNPNRVDSANSLPPSSP